MLEALLLTHTFIFLGAGFSDPDIRLMLEDYTYRNTFKRKHYFVIPKNGLSDDEFEINAATLSLKFLKYDSKDNHKELTDSISQLRALVESKRGEIAGTFEW